MACLLGRLRQGAVYVPHVYDYAEGGDAETKTAPITGETYNRRRYLTCYGKTQRTEFGTVFVDRKGEPNSYTGGIVVGTGTVSLSSATGQAIYNFSSANSGTYDIAVELCFPFWDKNGITLNWMGYLKHSQKQGSGGHIGSAPTGQYWPRQKVSRRAATR